MSCVLWGAAVVQTAAPSAGAPFLTSVWDGVAQQAGALIVAAAWPVSIWLFRHLNRRSETPRLHVYLSATLDDLNPFRSAAIGAIAKSGATHLGDPEGPGTPKATLAAREAQINACDLFIGLYGFKYGPRITGSKQSITDRELELAEKAGKPGVLWRLPDHAPVLRSAQDRDPKNVDALRARVQAAKGHLTVAPLPDQPGRLGAAVADEISKRALVLHPREQLRADLTSPAAIGLAGGLGVACALALVLRDLINGTQSNQVLTVVASLVAFAATYGARLLVLRRS